MDGDATGRPVEDVTWMGTRYRILQRAADTGGSLGMWRSTDQPGFGPPLHVHKDADETFLVLAGTVDFARADDRLTLGPGGTVFVPRGTPHTFRVRDDGPADMVTIMTPGGFEGFFVEVAGQGIRMPEEMDRLAPVAAAFHVDFVGPPLPG